MENCSPARTLCHCSCPFNLYSQDPATHSMISALPVLKVSVEGRTTPTLLSSPLAVLKEWEMQRPSK